MNLGENVDSVSKKAGRRSVLVGRFRDFGASIRELDSAPWQRPGKSPVDDKSDWMS